MVKITPKGFMKDKKKASENPEWGFVVIRDDKLKEYVDQINPRRKVNKIVVHHTGSDVPFLGVDSWRSIDRYHKRRGWMGIGYHFGITPEGRVWVLRPIHLVGAHAEGHNVGSIGVVVWGNRQKTHTAIIKLAEFVALLSKRFGAAVFFHKDLKKTACPNIDKQRFMKLVNLFGGE